MDAEEPDEEAAPVYQSSNGKGRGRSVSILFMRLLLPKRPAVLFQPQAVSIVPGLSQVCGSRKP